MQIGYYIQVLACFEYLIGFKSGILRACAYAAAMFVKSKIKYCNLYLAIIL